KTFLISSRGGGLICLTFLSISLPDQSSFFTEYSPNQIQFDSSSWAQYQALLDTTYSKSVKIVSVDDLRSTQSSGILVFQLPGSTDTLVAEANSVDENERVQFSWWGQLQNYQGYVYFNISDGLTSGYITKGKEFYEILPFDSLHQFFVQRNRAIGLEGCGIAPDTNPPPDSTGPDPNQCDYDPDYNTCPALISVLVIADEGGQQFTQNIWGGLGFMVRLGEAMTNQAFYNSDIPNKEVRVSYILKNGFSFNPNFNFLLDLEELRTWSSAERAAHKADIVVLLTGEHYPTAGGIATLDGAPAPDKAFAIIEADDFISQAAFPHELGHLFGCRHNWSVNLGNDNTEVCAHAFRHYTLGPPPHEWELPTASSWRTIVGVPIPDETYIEIGEDVYQWNEEGFIMHYSNPAVKYYGTPTGRSTGYIANNAQQIRNTGCSVAEHFPSQELAAFIRYSPTGCSPNKTFSVDIIEPETGLPGVPPYTVEWYWNRSGIFDYPDPSTALLGTGASISLTAHPACPQYWVKCIVRSSDWVTVSRIIKVNLGRDCECEVDAPPIPDDRGQALLEKNIMEVYPNPTADGRINVRLSGYTGPVRFELFDIHGRVVFSGAGSIEAGMPLPLGLPTLPAGVYALRLLEAADIPFSHTIVLTPKSN
ncbi:MAG: T9SS type A sorting domain-containing protein, partial [Saprospiraceae bacterium]|nr:T9SS type A sorting domain-containing protein [Saprospiraceae bacterium]